MGKRKKKKRNEKKRKEGEREHRDMRQSSNDVRKKKMVVKIMYLPCLSMNIYSINSYYSGDEKIY